MPHMTTTTVRAEHVGSLLRPASLMETIDHLGAHTAGMTSTQTQHQFTEEQIAELRDAENAAITEAVRHQVDAGIGVITDGEFRRTLFVNSFYDAIDGVRPADPAQHGRTWTNSRGESVTYPGGVLIERRLAKVDSPAAREAEFVAGLTDRPVKVTFPAASWFVSPLARQVDKNVPGYDSIEELQVHALDILKELIRDAIDAGAESIQLDFPPYVMLLDEGARGNLIASGIDPDALLERSLWADRYVREGLPDNVTYGLHLCRGNNQSSWLFEGALDPIAEPFFALPYDRFLIEWDDEERDGGFGALAKVPADRVVVLGIVDSKSDMMETEDGLRRKIDAASAFIDVGQLALSPQCGFASSHEGNLLSEDAQWSKLELIGNVAEHVWNGR
jgi:5-methyltetrahydropteroyltriglutamate--homocysteine methyltransferase